MLLCAYSVRGMCFHERTVLSRMKAMLVQSRVVGCLKTFKTWWERVVHSALKARRAMRDVLPFTWCCIYMLSCLVTLTWSAEPFRNMWYVHHLAVGESLEIGESCMILYCQLWFVLVPLETYDAQGNMKRFVFWKLSMHFKVVCLAYFLSLSKSLKFVDGISSHLCT